MYLKNYTLKSENVKAPIRKVHLKEKEYKNTNGFYLNVFEKLHIVMQTARKSDT